MIQYTKYGYIIIGNGYRLPVSLRLWNHCKNDMIFPTYWIEDAFQLAYSMTVYTVSNSADLLKHARKPWDE